MQNLKIKIYYSSLCLQIFCTHGSNQLQVKNIFELHLNWTLIVHFLNNAIYTNCLYSTCICLALYVIKQHLRYGDDMYRFCANAMLFNIKGLSVRGLEHAHGFFNLSPLDTGTTKSFLWELRCSFPFLSVNIFRQNL